MKPLLLISLDGSFRVMPHEYVPKSHGEMPRYFFVPTLAVSTEAVLDDRPPGPVRDDKRRFELRGELRHYWVYEEAR